MSQPWTQPGYNAKDDPNNSYGYVPSKELGIAFVVLFAVATFVHAIQAGLSRRAWLITMVAGGIGETLGWAGRLWAAYDLYNTNAFYIEICCLIICPAFFSAAVYAIAGWIMVDLDPSLSLLRPTLYWRIFVTCDVISLVIQSAGGGMAASASDQAGSNLGSNIMLAGIVFQLVTTTLFSALWLHFLLRVKRAALHPSGGVRWLVAGNLFATAMIGVRGVYRVIELAQGWNGYLIEHEPWFLLDAVPMFLLMVALAITHPCWTLRRPAISAASLGHGGTPGDSTASGLALMSKVETV